MHRYYFSNVSRFCTALTLLVILSGCTSIPTGKYEALNDSTKQLLDKTSDTYTRIEKLQRYFVAITAPNSSITANYFKPEIDGQSYDIAPELRFRENALEVMAKYTTLLAALSTKDYQTDVDKASQNLAGSLKNLGGTSIAGVDTKKVAGIIGTLTDVVGKLIIDHKRADALRTAMDAAQDNISNLSALIVGSNTKIKKFVDQMRNRFIAHANAARPPYASSNRVASDLNTAQLLAEIDEIDSSLDLMSTAIVKIPDAHREIRATLDKKGSTVESLQGLIQEAQRASKMYKSLGQ